MRLSSGSGKNIELVPDKKIVQDWRAVDWQEGHFSRVTFEFTPVTKGTRLDFTHADVPEGTEEAFEQGWIDNYWQPLKAFIVELCKNYANREDFVARNSYRLWLRNEFRVTE